MKISISKLSLLDPLTDLVAIVDNKTTQPILGHVCLKAEDGVLTLKSTDTEVSLNIRIPVTTHENGETTVPGHKFLNLVRKMPGDVIIDCVLAGEQLKISGAGSTVRLSTLPAADFPMAETPAPVHSLTLDARQLHRIMSKVEFSMAREDVRFYLNGLYLNVVESGNGLHAVTTDGHRLSCAYMPLAHPCDESVSLILPRKGVRELIKLLARGNGEVTLNISERQLTLALGNHHLSTRLIDGQYPNYQQVLPPNQETPVLINTGALISALDRAKVLLVDKHDGIRLRFEGAHLHLAARNLENESLDDHLDIINPENLHLDTGLNINYLMDAVRNIEGENLQIHLTEGERPCLLTSQEDRDVRYVIMPMRL